MSGFRVEPDVRAVNQYWREVSVSDGFDLEGITPPTHPLNLGGLTSVTVPQDGWTYPFRGVVTLYARFGLHRFNMKEGTKWELDNIIKFNVMTPSLASIFFITLAAHDSDIVTRRGRQIFQVRVDEIKNGVGCLGLVCSIARVKGDRDEPVPIVHSLGVPCDSRMLDWPSNDDYLHGLYLVEGSELLDTHWIRLYLELAIRKADRKVSDFSNLMIVKAVIDTAEKEAPLNAKNSVLYIVFKGVVVRGVAEHVERKAVIKTDFNEQTGFLSIKGVVCRGPEDSPPLTPEEKRRFFLSNAYASPFRQTTVYDPYNR